ncbi:xylosidase : arabinofuranosidase [Hortaea werneckii]|nr:xylosidase : arabinofuranosidase [Hortaea werneckii]
MRASIAVAAFAATTASKVAAQLQNSTYYNPVVPGWHSDPSCTFVDDTFFCAFSTFLVAPGLPIYASKDLINWRLASHGWSRPDQIGLPNAARNVDWQQGGFFAPNLRYHDDKFWLTCTFVEVPWNASGQATLLGTVQSTSDPFDSAAWSDAVTWDAVDIDGDLFWDDDGTVYLHSAGIRQQTIDLQTGEVSEPVYVWKGTGSATPEGPHIYKRDGWYYLMIGEGGTELGHMETIARARNITGPYESNPNNPLISNANTTEYFQTVGHCDLFPDGKGNDWAMCLATRSGPEWEIYPMGRESILTPVRWDSGEWPVFSQAHGLMSGWLLPAYSHDVDGIRPFIGESDCVDFEPHSSIPTHFLHWRWPQDGAFTVSPEDHPNSLQIVPSRANLTGAVTSDDFALTGKTGISFIGRRQTHTLFTFGVDLKFSPEAPDQEAGITAFLTQLNHISLGIAQSNVSDQHSNGSGLEFRFHVETLGTINSTILSSTVVTAVPWCEGDTTHLQMHTVNETHYGFSAWPTGRPNEKIVIGHASAEVVSGGSGPFVGALLGAYATCNGAGSTNSTTCPDGGNAYFSRWRYTGAAQEIAEDEFVPSF